MARIKSFDLLSVEIPFNKPFKHAAAERHASHSLFLKCTTASGSIGFGECLPREYVSGETRDRAFDLLERKILPNLIGMPFDSLEQVMSFLNDCNGKAPQDWVEPTVPQTAAWAAVDLALLDAFGHTFNASVCFGNPLELDPDFRYSVVISGESGFKAVKLLTKIRLYGFRFAKLKVDAEAPQKAARLARGFLGKKCDIRADANMAWDVPQAIQAMKALSKYGIYSFEQPLKADDIDGLARLVKETGLAVMADESLDDAESLENLIRHKACTAVNVRISKCGGLMAAFNRCRRALEEGLTVQVGCQVGETSLLSAAQLILIAGVKQVAYAEGCFGLHLLREDPVEPLMQFGYGGRPPELPRGPGLGVTVNEVILNRYCVKREKIAVKSTRLT